MWIKCGISVEIREDQIQRGACEEIVGISPPLCPVTFQLFPSAPLSLPSPIPSLPFTAAHH